MVAFNTSAAMLSSSGTICMAVNGSIHRVLHNGTIGMVDRLDVITSIHEQLHQLLKVQLDGLLASWTQI
jgi:hypothetical protein